MSVKSTELGGIRLSGADAEAFMRQVTYGRPKKAAVAALKRGRALSKKMDKAGRVKITPRQG